MNKSAIKNFAIWARNKLIADITYKAGLLGISEKEIKEPLPQSTKDVQFFDIGTKEPYSISGVEIKQREALAEKIRVKCLELRTESLGSRYKSLDSELSTLKPELLSFNSELSTLNIAFKAVVEEVAYTWFNRLIAVRFMEVNEYIPSRVRVISSESAGKDEPDLVTNPFDTDLEFTPYEKDRIMQLKQANLLDELFRLLFIKQCNALNAILPNLFEKTSDYTELLLNVAFTDKEGVVYHLVHDLPEEDFKIRTEADEEAIKRGELIEEEAPSGQVEIIGWLYQYYNTEPKDETFALLKKNVKITKERIPAATQLFTPDWIVRYMVENSLGRIFIEWSLKGLELSEQERIAKEKNIADKMGWKYYLTEAEQEPEVRKQLNSQLLTLYTDFHIENVKIIDPCMGSGHILVYAFDVLMQIYESCGYSQRDAAKSIIENNIFGLDIDNRAYQLAYFALMMKARQYNRRILNGETKLHVYAIQESNGINRDQMQYFGAGMDEMQRNVALLQIQGLLDTFIDAKEYGSILNVDSYDWELLRQFVDKLDLTGQLSFDMVGVDDTQSQLYLLVEIGAVLARKYDVVVTNPPYMAMTNSEPKTNKYVKDNYPNAKADLYAVFIKKCGQMAKKNGYQAMITMQSWMFLTSFEDLREEILQKRIVNLLKIGFNSFPEMNSQVAHACSFVIRNSTIKEYNGIYFDLNTGRVTDDKNKVFLRKKDANDCFAKKNSEFHSIPGTPLVFSLSYNFIKAFKEGVLLGNLATARNGMKTGDNGRFLRLWWEVSSNKTNLSAKDANEAIQSSAKWFPYNKGGDFRKWYGNNDYVVNWENSGNEIFNCAKADGRNVQDYPLDLKFTLSVSWSLISSVKPSFRLKLCNLSDIAGMSFYTSKENVFYLLGYCNTLIALEMLQVLAPTINFQAGDIARLPILFNKNKKIDVDRIVHDNIRLSRNEWDLFETSWDFKKHLLLCGENSITESYVQWQQLSEMQFVQLKSNEEELNRIFIEIYGLQDELTPDVEDKDVTIRKADLGRDIRSFISYAVGCMFGRYSLDEDGLVYAGGQWDDSKYSTFIPDKDNIIPITDEEYFEDDIVGLFVAFVKKVYGVEKLEENLDFIARALGSKGDTARDIIRNYFLKDFFKDHCKIYQKRPIYWLFDSGKANGFKALIYMHRYDENTIGNLRIDYLHKMQRVYEREIVRMQETIDNSTNAREVVMAEKRKDKLTKQLQETKDYDEKIAHLALARIAIDLDDGVKVNYEKVQIGTDGKKLEVLAKI
ncbi:MAG: BREX-1 system adenine-specific DNA-methyltransferase PglX [Negativicutes bacterium]|nr:BREX-1 system adenine-specific DNA-methyltransferase PglX [Negativicutes bacterium]